MLYSSQSTKMWNDFTDDGMNVILPGHTLVMKTIEPTRFLVQLFTSCIQARYLDVFGQQF